MKQVKKWFCVLSAMLLIVLSTAGCAASQTAQEESTGGAEASALSAVSGYIDFDEDDLNDDWASAGMACEITFSGEEISASGNGASVSGNTVTITSPGVYSLSGNLEDGQLIVNSAADGKVWLVFDGVEINCSTSAAVWIQQADRVMITLAPDSVNRLSDGSSYQLGEDEDEPNAALFSEDDLTINGTGTLEVTGNWANGIQSKDDLRIVSGNYVIESVNNGIKGKDRLGILDATININCGGNAIQSDNEDDPQLGLIYIAGGSLNVNAGEDGIEATNCLLVAGGELVVTSGGGSANAQNSTRESYRLQGGGFPDTLESEDLSDTASGKGLKADVGVTILDGSITVDSADDAIHSNQSIEISGGALSLSTGDDGVHADESLKISGGQLDVLNSYEGLESARIEISGGEISIQSQDDGINAADGTVTGGFGGFQQGQQDSGSECVLQISGGSIYIDADADGIDSNGSVYISGGEVRIEGPINDGNGALDYDREFEMTGGSLAATGSAGMAQTVSSLDGVCGVTVWLEQEADAGSALSVAGPQGETLLTVSASKVFAHAVIVSPALEDGENYTLLLDGEELGSFTASAQAMATVGTSRGGMSAFWRRRPAGRHAAIPAG